MAKPFRVALNPRNPEAASWYDPETGVNLFLGGVTDRKGEKVSGPISEDLSKFSERQLQRVISGINAGHLIVVEGDIPEAVELDKIPVTNSPRSRWDRGVDEKGQQRAERSKEEEVALKSWDDLVFQKKQKENSSKSPSKA